MRISIYRDDAGGYEQFLKVRDQDITVTLDGVEQDIKSIALADEEQSEIREIVRNADGSISLFENEICTVPKYGVVVITCQERPFDAQAETLKHIGKVRELMELVVEELRGRAAVHDESKFSPEEAPYLQKIGEIQQREGKVDFGTPEYEERKKIIAPMIAHHYAHNDHHVEHYGVLGIAGMTLFALVEMFCDQAAAATDRNASGVYDITANVERYGMSEQLKFIFGNTAAVMGIPHK